MKLLPAHPDNTEDVFSTEEGFPCPPRLDFYGHLHNAPKDRWGTGWKPPFESWLSRTPNRMADLAIARNASCWELDAMEEFLECRQLAAMPLSGGGRGKIHKSIQEEIASSRSILDLEDDWDDQGSPRYSEDTWRRACDFLLRQANFARANLGCELPVPKILPGPGASIDLHWKLPDFELLVNIPADATQPATFYGDDYRDSCVRGNLNPSEEVRGLVVWLLV